VTGLVRPDPAVWRRPASGTTGAFLRALAAAEIATGTALLTPVVANKLAGAALTAFSGSLVALHLRTPAMHKHGSVWPTPSGMAVSKDVWMLGIGPGLLASPAAPGEAG
jgi:hypothetical protein